MQVIMTATGEVKQVPNGYARNYLLPHKLATAATPEAIVQADAQQAQRAADQAAQQSVYSALAAKVAGTTVTYEVKASEAGRLFRAVHAEDIVGQLQSQGIVVPALSVTVPPIKQVGAYEATLRLPDQPACHFTVTIIAQ
ncbi:MAG: hypothetical protein ACD_41C00345G0005 [uncultured bacterium]|nr:MAG: hypothetical protein ACD_41C00345G0005 [uncultured bacterium]HBY73865.1 50S ribosomal protein L9 [Candidatus Kerfeldbacteria bacterium]